MGGAAEEEAKAVAHGTVAVAAGVAMAAAAASEPCLAETEARAERGSQEFSNVHRRAPGMPCTARRRCQ
jgi:hypothetical protein